jgi:hypothetical protein
MAQTTNQPSAATRPNTATAQLDTNGLDAVDQQNQRGENGQVGEGAERRENLPGVRDERDNEPDDSRKNHDERSNFDREYGENRSERTRYDGDAEQDSREQPPVLSAGMDAFAPVFEAWTQVFKSWSELAETMVKAQQDVFASMIGAANMTAKDIPDIKVGDRNGELAFSGSRTTASTPDRIEHDRR